MTQLAVEYSSEESLSLISNKAKESNVDSFRIRIMRRVPGRSTMDQTATLDEATAEHCSMPESWLPLLVGGGEYCLTVYHASDKLKPLGGVLKLNVNGPPKEIDTTLLTQPEWNGPRMIIHPKPEKQTNGNGRIPIGYSVDQPHTNGNGNGREASAVGAGIPPFTSPQVAQRIMEDQLRAKERELEKEKQKLELDNQRREFEARIRDMERNRTEDTKYATLMKELEGVKNKAPDRNSTAELVTALAPVLAAFATASAERDRQAQAMQIEVMKAQAVAQQEAARLAHETQIKIAEIQAKAEADRRESARLQSESDSRRQDTAAAQNNTLLQALLAKPPIDPAIREVLKEVKENNGSQVISQMTTGMSAMMQMISTVMESNLLGGPEEPVAISVAKEVSKVIGSVAEAYVASKNVPTINMAALPAAAARFGDMPQQPQTQAPPQPRKSATIDAVINKMFKKEDATEVAKFFLHSLNKEDMKFALHEVGGDFTQLFIRQKNLVDWIQADPTNAEYGKKVLDEIVRLGTEAGIIGKVAPKKKPVEDSDTEDSDAEASASDDEDSASDSDEDDEDEDDSDEGTVEEDEEDTEEEDVASKAE